MSFYVNMRDSKLKSSNDINVVHLYMFLKLQGTKEDSRKTSTIRESDLQQKRDKLSS